MLSGIIVYGIVYQFYVKWFDRSVVQSDPNRPTPAHTYLDGVEFFPSNKYVMLGWHWKSIAALGPVTGPALAIVWGWLPGFLWILIGNSLLGWLHDYNSMMTSVRSEGASLGPLTYQIIGKRARRVLVAFLAFYSILIFAAFLGALLPIVKNQAFVGASAIVAFMIIAVIGVASGYAIFKAKINVVAVTIACGACSGWHGLIGSSLSSKQLDTESDAHFVGGGGMLLEGVLGLTSVVAVAALTSKTGCAGSLGLYVCGGAQYLGTFGIGSLVGKGIMALMVIILGLTLTQLALRFARLAISEMVKLPALKNVYVTSIIVSIITFVLTSSRFGAPWGFIWTLFGGSNQLLAGVTLLVATLWLTKSRRRGIFTGIPAIFMLVTTIAALGYTAYATLDIALTTNIATSATRAYGSAVAGVIAIILTALGLVLSYDGFKAYRGIRSGLASTPSISTGISRASPSDNKEPTKSAAPRSPEDFSTT